jgi:hypothetical protein
MSGLGIDAADGADHLRSEKDVVRGNHLGQELDSRAVIDTGVEKYVAKQMILEQRPLHILREPAVAAPEIRHGAAAMRNDELERWKIAKEIGRQKLHERGRARVDVVGASRVKLRVARRADVNHGRNVELDHRFVERVPPAVGQRRLLPVPARGIRIQIAADESQLVDAALELGNASFGRHAW